MYKDFHMHKLKLTALLCLRFISYLSMLHFDMLSKIITIDVRFVTEFALKWLDSWMQPFVGLKTCYLTKWFFTSTALAWFNPVWSFLCIVIAFVFANGFSQNSHWYGFSPEWVLEWLDSPYLVVKDCRQTSHRNGFTPPPP